MKNFFKLIAFFVVVIGSTVLFLNKDLLLKNRPKRNVDIIQNEINQNLTDNQKFGFLDIKQLSEFQKELRSSYDSIFESSQKNNSWKSTATSDNVRILESTFGELAPRMFATKESEKNRFF